MASDPPDAARLEHAARSARRAVALALVATAIMVAVLVIDQQIKRDILAEAARLRRLLDDLHLSVLEAGRELNGEQRPGPGAETSQPDPDPGDSVANPARPPAAADSDASHPRGAGGRGTGGTPRRAPGHG